MARRHRLKKPMARRAVAGPRIAMVAAAALALLAGSPALAQAASESLNFLDTPVDITPGSAGSWVDRDLSSYVPSGATGAIIQFLGTSSDEDLGVRMNGSTDTWMLNSTVAVDSQTGFLMTGLDAGRVCEVYVGSAAVTTWLVGYTMEGVTFFTNAVDKSLTSTATWEDIDISTDTGADTAIGAIFTVHCMNIADHYFALRKKGSTDDRYRVLKTRKATTALIGVDGNEVAELKIANLGTDTRLIGYVTSGAVFFTNAVDKSTGTTGSYVDVDITGDVGTDDPSGVILEFVSTGDSSTDFAVRTNGAGHDIYGLSKHDWAYAGVDASNIFEQKIGGTDKDCYLIGYVLEDPVNYRSIGTDTGTLYSTGNATIAQDARVVTFGGGASLPANVGVGDELVIGSETFYIKAKDSATQVTVHSPATSSHTGSAYTIARAYNDIQSWEDARDGDLVGENRREVGVCYDDGDFTPASEIQFEGSDNSDASHNMTLTVAEGQRHAGVAGAGVVIDGSGTGADAINVGDPCVRIEWVQITNFKNGSSADGIELDDTDPSAGSVVANVIIFNFDGAGRGVRIEDDVTLRNVIIYDGESGIRIQDGAAANLSNLTVFDTAGDGIACASDSSISVRNTISVGNGTDIDISGTVDYADYNMYETASGFTAGANDQSPPADLDNLFVSIAAGTEDLHLEPSGHNAVDTGFDLSSDFTTDIDGETRSAPWDLGADEGGVTSNYRSIGTDTSVLYQTGDATIAAGGTVVTFGGGASLPMNVGQGDELVIGAETFYIYSRDSATQVTVQTAAAAAHSGAAYTIERAYNDIQVWENDRDGDLSGENRREVGVCYNDGEFADGDIVIDGSTTSSSCYMKLTVAEGQRHTGIAGTGVCINGASAVNEVMNPNDQYTVIEWLEIRNFDGMYTDALDIDSDNVVVQNLLIYDYPNGSHAIGGDGAFTVRNTILHDGEEGIRAESGTVVIENVTIYNMSTQGIYASSGVNGVEVRNSIVVGNDTDIVIDCPVDYFGYNMYSSTSGFTPSSYAGNNQSPPADLSDLFYSITPGSENLHIEDSGHNAVDTGLDLSSTFTGDIDGATRSAPWDIGADEVTALPLRISSGANQTFTVGDPTTAISAITVTDHGSTPTITAADDIRIRIPAAFNMEWDVFDTDAVILGSAAGKVSTTVSYEDSGKTLVIDVTTGFAASDAITISALSFTDFSAVSATDYLTLDVNNDASADATDDKTIEIEAAPAPPASTGTPLVSWREVEPEDVPAPSSSSSISFDDVTTNTSTDSRNSASFAHTVDSCSCCTDGIIVVVVVTRGDQEATAVSYGGQALALAISEQASTSGDNEWVTIWYRTDPLPGTNMVDVTYDSSASPDAVTALSYFGVDQSSPIGATAGASDTSSSNPVTVSISTTVDGSVVVGGLGQHGEDTYPHDQGTDITTEHWDVVSSGGSTSSDSGYAGGEIVTTTTGIYTFEWTGNADDDWAIACVELKPAQ